MKCAKCGHVELYWRADWHDVEREYAKLEDVMNTLPLEVREGPDGKVIEASDGFAYRKGTATGKPSRYVRRVPLEVWKARQFWTRPKGYFDPAGSISRGTLVVKSMEDAQKIMARFT